MNTYKSVSKQRTLTTFIINTYEKQGGRGLPIFRSLRKASHPTGDDDRSRLPRIAGSAVILAGCSAIRTASVASHFIAPGLHQSRLTTSAVPVDNPAACPCWCPPASLPAHRRAATG